MALGFSLGILLALTLAYPVQAATDQVDQSETMPTSSFQTAREKAQTFTPAVTGQIDQVSLYSGTPGTSVTSFLIEIWTVTGGQPAAVIQLDSTTTATTAESAALGDALGWHDFPLNRAVPLTAGTQYAIVVTSTNGILRWGYEDAETYPGGMLLLCCSSIGAWMSGASFGVSFDFKTWMATGITQVNQPPTVAANSSAVTVNEGTAPANTGTYADPDGDTVALSASSGTVTTSSGTWSWTQPASDEASSQTVTITADDGNGLKATTTFTVTVQGVAPAAHISSAPSTAPEGTPVTLVASATSPSAADNAAGFTYQWTTTKNGNPFSTGTGPSFSFTPDDEGTFVVTLQATDDGGMTGATSLTLDGANVAPSATISKITPSAPLVLTAQESVGFSGSFSDPGALDSHTATWNFGDGVTSTSKFGPGGSAGLSASHTYAAGGSYSVSLTVTDDDGGVGNATAKFVVQTPQQALSSITAYVQGIKTLTSGQKRSLLAKLDAASESLARGNTKAASHQLSSFLNELQADVEAGKVTGATGDTLRAAVHALQADLAKQHDRIQDREPAED